MLSISTFLLFTLIVQLGSFTNGATIEVNDKYNYGQFIRVNFNNPAAPKDNNFIGLYKRDQKNIRRELTMWSDTCGSQKTFNDPTLCTPKASGTITFSADDPSHDFTYRWPLPPGRYYACLMSENFGNEAPTRIGCKPFFVKYLPKSYKCLSAVQTHARVYNSGDTIDASFVTPYEIHNSWVGIYRLSDLNRNKKTLPGEPLLWAFTGCNNRFGDQTENNSCSVAVNHGAVEFDLNSSEPFPLEWPLAPGKYKACLSFDNNLIKSVYMRFTCSTVFTVI